VRALHGWTVRAAEGRRNVTGAVLAPLDGSRRERIECDLLIVSGGDAPATALVTQAGGTTVYDDRTGQFKISKLPAGVWGAGQLVGEGGWAQAAASGELVGLQVAAALGLGEA